MPQSDAVARFARRIAREAGQLALTGFRSSDLVVSEKQDRHDVVTELDGACEDLLRERILAAFPDSTIVGEEGAAHRGTGALTWYLDPIDGTSNFARGIPLWAVSIGVEAGGELIAGVIFDPVADHLFWADDRGAFLDTPSGTEPLRSAGAAHLSGATVAMNFPLARDLVHFPDLALQQFAEVTREAAQIRMLGSTCIALAWIAAGWIDATVSFHTNPWDVAAGSLLVRRAGGSFLGFHDGETAPAAQAHLAPHYFAAVRGVEVEPLLDIMRTQSQRPNAARPGD